MVARIASLVRSRHLFQIVSANPPAGRRPHPTHICAVIMHKLLITNDLIDLLRIGAQKAFGPAFRQARLRGINWRGSWRDIRRRGPLLRRTFKKERNAYLGRAMIRGSL